MFSFNQGLFSFIGNHKKTSILRSKWKPCLIKEMWARLQKLRGPSYFYAGQKDSPPCWRRPIDATRAAWAAWSASRPGCSGSPRWCGGAGKPSSTRTEWPGRRLSMEEKERQSVRVNRADGLFPYATVKGVVLVGKVENVKCQMFISKASWVYKWVCVCGICFHGWHLGAISRSNMGDNHAKWQCIMFSWFS